PKWRRGAVWLTALVSWLLPLDVAVRLVSASLRIIRSIRAIRLRGDNDPGAVARLLARRAGWILDDPSGRGLAGFVAAARDLEPATVLDGVSDILVRPNFHIVC